MLLLLLQWCRRQLGRTVAYVTPRARWLPTGWALTCPGACSNAAFTTYTTITWPILDCSVVTELRHWASATLAGSGSCADKFHSCCFRCLRQASSEKYSGVIVALSWLLKLLWWLVSCRLCCIGWFWRDFSTYQLINKGYTTICSRHSVSDYK